MLSSAAYAVLTCAVMCCPDTEAMLNSWTTASFDEAVTLKLLGYPSPHMYYRHACSTNYIPHIRTPTLALLSKDDPFLG
jgi:predicted alpha/beta-fold hydrolase